MFDYFSKKRKEPSNENDSDAEGGIHSWIFKQTECHYRLLMKLKQLPHLSTSMNANLVRRVLFESHGHGEKRILAKAAKIIQVLWIISLRDFHNQGDALYSMLM